MLKMRSYMQKYAAHMQIYANFWTCSMCSMIFAYAILKIVLYAEKYAMCVFW